MGVGIPGINWYCRKKDDLLNAMTDVAVDTFFREMPPLPDGKPWAEVLYNYFRDARNVHRNDQVLSDLLLIRTSTYTRSEEHTSELQSHLNLVCRLLLEKKKIRR